MYDYTVFIGRFQPVHVGHLNVMHEALRQSDRLIILIGSANRARDIRNPWNYMERREMISRCFTSAERDRIFFAPIEDFLYTNNGWVKAVQEVVNKLINPHNTNTNDPYVALIGHRKDNSSYYLNLFPQWASIDVSNNIELNATDIRRDFFHADKFSEDEWNTFVPQCVDDYLHEEWLRDNADIFCEIQEEFEFVDKYKEQWKTTKEGGTIPYPVVFHTVDSVVVQSGHVLLIKRGENPGKGKWALPGGFLEYDETLLEGALRELDEETKLKGPKPVLLGSLVSEHTFDDPYRSSRGRTITNAFYFKLRDMRELPKVKFGSDAKEVRWVPIAELKASELFEDHYFIINYFLNQK